MFDYSFKYFFKTNHPNLKLEDHSNFLSQSLDNNRNHPNTKASYNGEAPSRVVCHTTQLAYGT